MPKKAAAIKKALTPKKTVKKATSSKPLIGGHNCACCTAVCGSRK